MSTIEWYTPTSPRADYAAESEVSSNATPVAVEERIFLAWRTAAELAAAAPVTVAWVAAPWVAAGAITELAGPPKAAGKTTFALHLIAAVLDGRGQQGRDRVGDQLNRADAGHAAVHRGPRLVPEDVD